MIAELQYKISIFKRLSDTVKDIDNIVNKVVEDNKDILLSLNRDQMLLGRDSQGDILSPSYLQDPYFNTPQAAQSYARMKYALESSHNSRLWAPVQLYPEKDRNTPNLIVTGLFQGAMYITTGSGKYTLGSNYINSPDIETKYRNRVFGLAPRSKEYFYLEVIKPEIIKALDYGMQLR